MVSGTKLEFRQGTPVSVVSLAEAKVWRCQAAGSGWEEMGLLQAGAAESGVEKLGAARLEAERLGAERLRVGKPEAGMAGIHLPDLAMDLCLSKMELCRRGDSNVVVQAHFGC